MHYVWRSIISGLRKSLRRGEGLIELVGFVLISVGIIICVFARRIVVGNMDLEEPDKSEFEMLASGAIFAVRLAGVVTAVLGVLFLFIRE